METNTPATQPFPTGDATKGPAVQDGPSTESVAKPARPKGPNASAIVLGLVAMAFAGTIIASEAMEVSIDWSRMGPGAIIGVGVLLVVLGAIGLVRRHDDA